MKPKFQNRFHHRDLRRISKGGLRCEVDIVGTDHTLFSMTGKLKQADQLHFLK